MFCSVLLRDSLMVGFVSHRSRVNIEEGWFDRVQWLCSGLSSGVASVPRWSCRMGVSCIRMKYHQ